MVNGTTPKPADPMTPVTITLPVHQINLLLEILRSRPLGEVIDVFLSIQGQGNMALAQRAAAMTNGAGESPPADPPDTTH